MGLGIKKDDRVMVIMGEEKGKRGRVLEVRPEVDRLIIESVNMIKKHMKPNQKYKQGGIIEKEAPIHRSSIMLVCPKCEKATRIGYKVLENSAKVRACKKCGEVID